MACVSRLSQIFRLFGLCHRRFASNYSPLKDCLSTVQNFQFFPYVLKDYNVGTSFSEAIVKPVECVADENGNLKNPETIPEDEMTCCTSYRINFKDLFADGLYMLSNPENIGRILSPLVHYFDTKEYHEKCLRKSIQEYRDGTKFTESQITMMLAIHLFSQLIFPSYDPQLTDTSKPLPYLVSNDIPDKVVSCPCGCGRTVFYGNTGFGSTTLWYGSPDILVFPNGGLCSISFPNATNPSGANVDVEEEQMVDLEKEFLSLRQTKSIHQFAAQAITFSFYQASFQDGNKLKDCNSDNLVSLIPTIAINKTGFDVYMYDSVNGIFLRNCGDPLPLWNEKLGHQRNATINLSSVIILWMLMNHLTFKPKVTQKHVSLFGGSCKLALDEDQLKEIKRTITLYNHFPTSDIQNKINLTKKVAV